MNGWVAVLYVDGIVNSVYGPFETEQAADEYADKHLLVLNGSFIIYELERPLALENFSI